MMLKKNRLLMGALISVLLVTAGCGASAPKEEAGGVSSPSGSSAPVTPKPATTVAQGNADKGKQLVETNCTSCHAIDDKVVVGPGLKGVYSKSTLLNGKAVNDVNMAEWIKMGNSTTMPSNPGLSEQDLADISSYLKTLK